MSELCEFKVKINVYNSDVPRDERGKFVAEKLRKLADILEQNDRAILEFYNKESYPIPRTTVRYDPWVDIFG